MRSTTSIPALALAFLQGTNALNAAIQRKFSLLADMGLNPDGSSMHTPTVDTAALQSLRIADASNSDTTAAEVITPEYVELPIDHFAQDNYQANSSQGTFFNRFWVRESAYKAGGPVFVYDVGEADAEPSALFRLQNETSFFRQIVDSYGGVGIVWEHRFYGNSTPEPIDVNTPPEAFRFLTTQQSLADVDSFAKQFSRKNINYTLTPDNTPWVFVGGSYPGMRAAFIRNMYPDTIYASYSASAPVQASIDQSFYFEPVWEGMNAYGFGNCTKDIHAAILYMDEIMDTDPAGAANLKTQLLGLGAANNSDATFADALATIFGVWQSYGMEGGQIGLRLFCDWIETDPDTQQLAPAEGWAESKGANFTVGRWATYPSFVTIVNGDMETNCSGSATVAGDCELNLQATDPASISWTWQYCTQWGYFQSANLGAHQLVSKFNSLSHQHDVCHRQFPTAPPSLLPDWPAVNQTNAVFGGWTIRPSNTYWSNGQYDPWRTLNPASAEPFAPQGVKLFTDPPHCGVGQSQDELFGYVIPDAEHCFDFRTTFAGGAVSRQFFTTALTQWLKCFTPKGGYAVRGRSWKA